MWKHLSFCWQQRNTDRLTAAAAVLDEGFWCVLFHFRSSPRANITLSGKKKRKLLKQLQHMQQEKAGMEGKTPQTCVCVCVSMSSRAQIHNVLVLQTRSPKSQSCKTVLSKQRWFSCVFSPLLSSYSSVEAVAAPQKKKQDSSSAPAKKKKRAAGPQEDVEMADVEWRNRIICCFKYVFLLFQFCRAWNSDVMKSWFVFAVSVS